MKALAISVVLLALLGSGGVAYACVVSPANGCHGANGYGGSCSEVSIVWTAPFGEVVNVPYVACSVGLNPQTLTITVTKIAPGDTCSFHAELTNVGAEAVALTETVVVSSSRVCAKFAYGDNVLSSPPRELEADHSFGFAGTISLSTGATDVCEGASATILVTITGAEVSKCEQVYEVAPSSSPRATLALAS